MRIQRGRKRYLSGIVLRALDARPVASRLWKNKDAVLLMSATIGGDASILAGSLGIDDHAFLTYPHPVPWSARPVYDLGLARMTWSNLKSSPALYTVQATEIARWIKSYPTDWRGVVLTSSRSKLDRLQRLLSSPSRLDGRVITTPYTSPSARLNEFIDDSREGAIMVGTVQGLGHGVDFYGDAARLLVVAGVPFDSPRDPFTQARRSVNNGDAYLWQRSYVSIVQACGRVARGEKDEDGGWMLNAAALADGSAISPRAKKHFPEWFRVERWR